MPSIVITYPFPIGRATGGARHVREIARHLGKNGAQVTIIVVSAGLKDQFPRNKVPAAVEGREFDEELAQYSVEIIRVRQNPFSKYLDGLGVCKAIKSLLSKKRIDLVLSFYYDGAFLPDFLAQHKVNFGYIAAWQSYARALNGSQKRLPFRLSKYGIDSRLVIEPYRQARVLFANSDFTRHELVNILGVSPERITVSPLGVDPVFFSIKRTRPDKIQRLIFFGRIIPSKGVMDALKALAQLSEREVNDWSLRIVGQGLHEWAQQGAEKLGIANKVSISGPVNDQELREELANSDLTILPSHFESFGLSIAEAQASGLAVVAYHAGSVPEIVIHDKTGWLAPLGEIRTLSAYIEKAMQEPDLTHRAGLAGRERIRENFSWDKTANIILNKLEEISTNHGDSHSS